MNWIGYVGIGYLLVALFGTLKTSPEKLPHCVFIDWFFLGVISFLLGWLGGK